MWILYAIGSAFFAGITSILAKCGISKADSNVATALRCIVILVFSWIMVFITGSFSQLTTISMKTLLFLVLSGFSTGASWLFYFKALQIGDINKVVAVDKSSIVLTILLSFLLFQEKVTLFKLIGMVCITIGTYFMIEKKKIIENKTGKSWFTYAILSVIFASLTTILGKIGITNIESNLGSAMRTSVVLVMSWVIVFVFKKQHTIKDIPKKELGFICLSGVATGASWLCFYKALKIGPASLVVPIDKLSILITVFFSYFVFHETISKKVFIGLLLITVGTLVMLIG